MRDRNKNSNEDPYKILLSHSLFKNEEYENDSLTDLISKIINLNINECWNIEKSLNHPSLQTNSSFFLVFLNFFSIPQLCSLARKTMLMIG